MCTVYGHGDVFQLPVLIAPSSSHFRSQSYRPSYVQPQSYYLSLNLSFEFASPTASVSVRHHPVYSVWTRVVSCQLDISL